MWPLKANPAIAKERYAPVNRMGQFKTRARSASAVLLQGSFTYVGPTLWQVLSSSPNASCVRPKEGIVSQFNLPAMLFKVYVICGDI